MSKINKRMCLDFAIWMLVVTPTMMLTSIWIFAPFMVIAMWNYYDGKTRDDLGA